MYTVFLKIWETTKYEREGNSCTSVVSIGHEMFMLLHGKTQENAELWNCKQAAFRSADSTHPPRGRMTIITSEIEYRN